MRKAISLLLTMALVFSMVGFDAFAANPARGIYIPTSTQVVTGNVVNLASSKIMFGANADGSYASANESASDYRFYSTLTPSLINIESYNSTTETGNNVGSVDNAILGFKFDFGSSLYKSLIYNASTPSTGSTVKVTLNKPNGQSGAIDLGTITVTTTGGWSTYQDNKIDINTNGITGIHTVYLNYIGLANNARTLTFVNVVRGVYTPTLTQVVTGNVVNLASSKIMFGANANGSYASAYESASDYRFYSTLNPSNINIESYNSTTEIGFNIGYIDNAILGFKFDFGNSLYKSLIYKAATILDGSTVTVTLDKPNGQSGAINLGTINVMKTGSWSIYQDNQLDINTNGITGIRTVYLNFMGVGNNATTLTFVKLARGVYTPNNTQVVTGNVVNLASSKIMFGANADGSYASANETASTYRFFSALTPSLINIESYNSITETGNNVGSVENAIIGFKFDFGSSLYKSLVYNASTPSIGSTVIFTLDKPNGQAGAITLGTIIVTNTGGWNTYQNNYIGINTNGITGIHTVYLNYIGLANNAKTLSFVTKPEVFVGVADNYMDQINNPTQWSFVSHNADGFYINFIELDSMYSQGNLNSYGNLFTNKRVLIESDMTSSLEKEQGYINKLHSAGFTIPYTSLNYGWSAERQANLKTYALEPAQEPRLCLVQQGPWCIGGSITGDNGPAAPYSNADYRSWINKADGISTDGPMGFWYVDQTQMKAGSYSMVKYAKSLGKKALVMIAPYEAGIAGYNASMFLSVGQSCVRDHEDNDADPDIWSVFEYAVSIPAVPEQVNGVPYNSTTGMAYYLINHIKGVANTLDLYAKADGGAITGNNIFSPDVATTTQKVTFNPAVPTGTVYHYALNSANLSSWCDYAAVLKATATGSTNAWSLTFKMGATDVTNKVLTSGFMFYKNDRLNPLTTKIIDVYITRTAVTGSTNFALNLELMPHNGSNTVDSMQITCQ